MALTGDSAWADPFLADGWHTTLVSRWQRDTGLQPVQYRKAPLLSGASGDLLRADAVRRLGPAAAF